MAVELVVKKFGGGEYKLEVDLNNTTVREVKSVLAIQSELSIEDQILVYNGATLSDTQILRDTGVSGSNFKFILGSKSSTPHLLLSTDEIVTSNASAINTFLMSEFQDHYTLEDISRISTFIWKRLHDLSHDVSFDQLEKVASDSWRIHEDVLSRRRDDYYKTFSRCES